MGNLLNYQRWVGSTFYLCSLYGQQLIYYCSSRIYLITQFMESHSKSNKIFHSMMQSYQPLAGKQQHSGLSAKINVPYHRIQEQIELYEWRSKNIQQVISHEWIKIEPFDQKSVTFTLRIAQKLSNLDEIKVIKGANTLKNISKIFSCFSLLYQKFGPFQISSKMIAYDTFFEPYAWINEDYCKNQYKRDLISQQQFASNILFILLKHDHKFENSQILDYCCEIKGQGYTLKEIAKFFSNFHEKELNSKQSKIAKSISQESTLSFSKQSRIKKHQPQKLNKEFKGLMAINNETFRSYLKSNDKQGKHVFQRTASLTEIKGLSYSEKNLSQSNEGSDIKINILKENESDYSERSRKGKDSFLPIHEELQISIDFENEEEMERETKVIELQQLDKFKKFLAKSIITGPYK